MGARPLKLLSCYVLSIRLVSDTTKNQPGASKSASRLVFGVIANFVDSKIPPKGFPIAQETPRNCPSNLMLDAIRGVASTYSARIIGYTWLTEPRYPSSAAGTLTIQADQA